MKDRLTKYLPWIALAGLIIAVASLTLNSRSRSQMLVEDNTTRTSALSTLTEVAALHPARADDPAFLQALKDMLQAPYIASVWLYAPDGEEILYRGGNTAAASAPSGEMQQVLDALPQDALQDEQSAMLKAVASMRIEGEHNDIYNHLIAPVESPDGKLIGFVGVAYEINPSLSQSVNVGYMASILALLVGLGLYWLALSLWVFLDARKRGERAAAWAVFVLLGNMVALVAYLIVRRNPTAPVQSPK